MFIASQKKKENIAEYLLYMWQMEDLIRANDLDIDKIQENIIDKFTGLTPVQKKDLTEWYESLIDMMKREGTEKNGHLQINKNTLADIADLHGRLMEDSKFPQYNAAFYRTLPYIVEIRSKAGENKAGEIESLFNALYGILLLRISGKEISRETTDAAAQISSFLAMLAKYYKEDRESPLFDKD